MNAKTLALLAGFLCSAGPLFAQGQQASPAEQRLREQLKSTMLQLRNAETERATLLAGQTERDQKIKKIEEQVAALTKQATEDKEAAEKAAIKLNEEIAARTADLARVNELLVKSDAAGKKTAELAKTKEEQRAKLAAQTIQLQRTVAEQRTKNAKMFETASEVLSRYEKFGLGTAITAREPFTGITRARLQSLADEYDDQLSAQRIAAAVTPEKAEPAEVKKRAKP